MNNPFAHLDEWLAPHVERAQGLRPFFDPNGLQGTMKMVDGILDKLNPKAGETRAETTGAHSGSNGGIRCAGTAMNMDRTGNAEGIAGAEGPLHASVAGGNSDPSKAEQTLDSAHRRSPAGQIKRPPALDESNQHPTESIEDRSRRQEAERREAVEYRQSQCDIDEVSGQPYFGEL